MAVGIRIGDVRNYEVLSDEASKEMPIDTTESVAFWYSNFRY
jgi:hypothetical protein